VAGTIRFGNAQAQYSVGLPVNWQTRTALRSRPEQKGADVLRSGGKEPVPFSMMAVLFGTTARQIYAKLRVWDGEVGHVKTLYFEDPVPTVGAGVTLRHYYPASPIIAIANATNSANYMLRINLVFARVSETEA